METEVAGNEWDAFEQTEDGLTIGLQVEPEFAGTVEADRLMGLVRRALQEKSLPGPNVEVALVVVGDLEMQELNRQYRGVDAPTDVLAFAMLEGEVMPAGDLALPVYLGDVIVSYPRAVAQAAEAGHPVEDELALLVVHGTLHLLGYDHDTEERKAAMWAAQDVVLGRHLVD